MVCHLPLSSYITSKPVQLVAIENLWVKKLFGEVEKIWWKIKATNGTFFVFYFHTRYFEYLDAKVLNKIFTPHPPFQPAYCATIAHITNKPNNATQSHFKYENRIIQIVWFHCAIIYFIFDDWQTAIWQSMEWNVGMHGTRLLQPYLDRWKMWFCCESASVCGKKHVVQYNHWLRLKE